MTKNNHQENLFILIISTIWPIVLISGFLLYIYPVRAELAVFDINVDQTVIEADLTQNQNSYKISGKISGKAKTVFINDTEITDYIENDDDWEVIVSEKRGSLAKGINEFTIHAIDNYGNSSIEKYVVINNSKSISQKTEEGGAEFIGEF